MTDSKSSEYIEELIALYVLDILSSEEAEELERLSSQNPEIVKQITQLQEVTTLLAYEVSQQPPAQLRTAVLAAVEQTASSQQSFNWISLPWGKIVAAIVILALAVDSYFLRQRLQRTQLQVNRQTEIIAILQQPNSRLVALKGVETNNASGSIVLDSSQRKIAIAITNLSRLPDNQIYRLWAVVNDKKTACGQFNASLSGTVIDNLTISENDCSLKTATLVVTKEPFPSPPQPVGDAVLIGKPKS
ncbi:anti-sigma factor [Calothrix sp. CCY 0018]|uniref:anti-sigma factor n=1 Tax=Calothrix sp. CCY 0018 TaxID=3103864 RepID=UPI0039C63FF0